MTPRRHQQLPANKPSTSIYKLFSSIPNKSKNYRILNLLKHLRDALLHLAGFRKKLSTMTTIDHIHTYNGSGNGKYQEQQRPPYVIFIDYQKGFVDTISQKSMRNTLKFTNVDQDGYVIEGPTGQVP